ncbi:MAG: phosphoadenosine phosphosulfate reductase family protein [Rhodocyclaceae bacterium]|nr:phosphoadenosine phosphosulfate reductase family protein [Rhodocyclaceae bacterium]
MNNELFQIDACQPSLTDRVEKAIDTLLALFRQGIPVICAYSGGKDSSCVAALVLMAARRAAAEGLTPWVAVTTSDTMVENPEVTAHFRAELAAMARYGARHGVRIDTQIVTPSLASSWQVKVLTGRALPSFPGTNADCSVDLKVTPQASWRSAFFRGARKAGLKEPVVCLGSRFEESERRRMQMLSRGDTDTAPVRNKHGEMVLCPIAMWDEDAVWELIGEAAAGTFGPCYSEFAEMRRIYAHSAGTSCAVVADALATGKKRGGCGARHGCWVCQQSQDKSLENMLDFDGAYAYMAGLNRFNRFLRATRWDWQRRHWVGRTIRAGYVAIEPDTYHPAMVRQLARYLLQLDFDEAARAKRAGEDPRFRILPAEMMVAIDALWSLNGMAPPFALWADWRDIVQRGVRYDIPDLPETPEQPMAAARFLHVGREWDDSASDLEWTGMQDPLIDGLAGCGPELRTLKNGHTVWDLPLQQQFAIDIESLCMLLDFELDRLIEMHDSGIYGAVWAYKWYASFGCLQLGHAQLAKHDEILRRTAFKDRIGLGRDYDIDALLARSVAFNELPAAARKAWAHKATTESAQAELALVA